MIEYSVACLSINDTELTHRNTYLIKEKERYSAIIMQLNKYIDDISSIIISLFINAGLLLKAYTNKIKCDSYLTSIGLTKIKIMDKGMEIEGEDDEDDEEEEEKKDKKADDDLTEIEKKEMEKYLDASPDQDTVDHIQKPEFFAYLLVFISLSLLYTSNFFSVPIIVSVLIYIILLRVNELDNYHKSLLIDYEKE
ncbi:hypothetical protein U3516DRAFT_850023 [Neocallimastix sp. 'constans']